MVFYDVHKPDSMPREIPSIALLLHAGCNARRKEKLALDFIFFFGENYNTANNLCGMAF